MSQRASHTPIELPLNQPKPSRTNNKLVATDPNPEFDSELNKAIPADIAKAQRADMSLKPFYTGLVEDGHGKVTGPKFKLKGEILYSHGDEREQLVVPGPLRTIVMELAHASTWGGHLGQNKTWDRVFIGLICMQN